MKISTEELPESQVALQIEVDDERLEKAMSSAFRRLASKTRIPGFRPGKAPRDVLERHLGEHAVLHEAIDRLLPQVYKEALEQEEIDPIDQADYDLVTEKPLVVKFTVPVQPKVDLGEYTALRVPRDPVVVDPARIDEALEGLRHRYATVEPVTRPIQWNDIVRADVHGEVDGKILVHEDDAEFPVVEGRTISLPGFVEALIGTEKGAELEFDVTVPDDAPDESLRGQQAHYQVHIKETKQENLPALDDEFARQAGEGFTDLAALRSRLEEDLLRSLEQEAEHRYHDEILEALAELATVEFPPVMALRETDRLLREQSGAAQTGNKSSEKNREQLERYLQQIGKSEEELRLELMPLAESRIRRSLVLSQATEAEDIHVDDSEVEAETSRMVGDAGSQGEEIRKLFSSDSAKESLRRSLLTKKTLERLVQIASTDGAASEEAEPDASNTGDEPE